MFLCHARPLAVEAGVALGLNVRRRVLTNRHWWTSHCTHPKIGGNYRVFYCIGFYTESEENTTTVSWTIVASSALLLIMSCLPTPLPGQLVSCLPILYSPSWWHTTAWEGVHRAQSIVNKNIPFLNAKPKSAQFILHQHIHRSVRNTF